MRSATVDDVGMWFCTAPAGVWEIVPATFGNGKLQIAGAPLIDGKAVLQIAECHVDGKTVLVLLAAHSEVTDDARRSLAGAVQARFGGAAVIVVLEISEGHLRVDTSFCDRTEAELAASFIAAAVIQARWGWDESACIRLEAGEQDFAVEPRYDGKRWVATIVE
jgi:hypothetical protein